MSPTTSELIRARLAEGSQPGQRTDPHRLALAIEGGGMRGVISAGMLLALEQLGMRSTFDFVCGTSAGALAGAFFVAEQVTQGSALFYTDLNAPPFLDRKRLLRRGKGAIDLDYLIGVAARRRGLDFRDLNSTQVPLYATVTPVDSDNPARVFRAYGSNERIASVLSATAALPVLAGGNRLIDGEHYVDGGLHEQVPWRTCATLGATHILALPSRPVSGTQELAAGSFIEKLGVLSVVRARHGQFIQSLVQSLPARATKQMWALRSIADGTSSLLTQGGARWDGHLELVEVPVDAELPARLETERPKLVDAMQVGAGALVDHFGLVGVEVEQRVVLTHPEGEVVKFRSQALRAIVTEQGTPG